MSTEQITIRLPIAMVEKLRSGAKDARRSLAAEVAWMLDHSPMATPKADAGVFSDAA